LKKNKVDPLGLGIIYRAHHYSDVEDLKHWEEIYPNLKFDVQVKVKLIGTGEIK